MPHPVNLYSVEVDGAKSLPREDNLVESVTVNMNMDYDKEYVDMNMLSEKDVVFNQTFIWSHCEEYNIAINLSSSCDDASRFFADECTLTDSLFNEQIQ